VNKEEAVLAAVTVEGRKGLEESPYGQQEPSKAIHFSPC